MPLKLKLISCATLLGLSTYALAQERTPEMDHPGWIHVPGELIRPDCVHEIPNGATVEPTGDVTLNGVFIAHYDSCREAAIILRPREHTDRPAEPAPANPHWIEASQWQLPLSPSDNINFMAGNWTVPNAPLTPGALIFLWNGIAPSNEDAVLQPVLQYGSNGEIGGNYWGIASWYVGPNCVMHSPLVENIPEGAAIYGFVQLTGTVGNTLQWNVQVQATTSKGVKASWIHKKGTSGPQWNWAYAGVLEAYSLSTCLQLPPKNVQFTNSQVATTGIWGGTFNITPGWSSWANPNFKGPQCGYSVIVNGTASTLFWTAAL